MTSNPQYGQETTATEVAKAFANEIRGKTVVIVGVSPQSLGESMALALASQSPALLILASRTRSKIEEVARKITAGNPSVRLEIVEIDLSSLESVRQGASAINQLVDQTDILINNAAVVMQAHAFTKDGLELQFGTNHIGLFLLTNLLLPKILEAAQRSSDQESRPTRIINVTSQGHVISPIRFSDPNFLKGPEDIPEAERPVSLSPGGYRAFDPAPGETYVPFAAYGQSKTANILTALYLNRHLASRGVRAIATHPGSIWTDLSRNLDETYTNFISKTGGFWKDLDQGSATTLVAALDPQLGRDESKDVVYLSDCQVAEPAAHASDWDAAERLWRLSEDIVGEKFTI
ncbi:Short-chain dehydrogenase TIC 32, chloroplastic [Exophiala dermatitidis]